MEVRINKEGLMMLSGQLGRDPEQKQTKSGVSLTTFSVAIGKRPSSDSPDQSETVWRSIACWRQLSDSAAKLHKGDTVLVIGTMSTNEYTDRDGNQKVSETVNAEAFFVTPPGFNRYAGNNSYSAQPYAPPQGGYAPQPTSYPPQNAMPYGQPQQPPYAHQQNGGFVPFEAKEDLPF